MGFPATARTDPKPDQNQRASSRANIAAIARQSKEETMLVLSRKVGEAIQAGSVWVRVLEIRGDKVRLGLEAPEEVSIWRAELLPVESEEVLELVEA
jgi:carbon storage regulator